MFMVRQNNMIGFFTIALCLAAAIFFINVKTADAWYAKGYVYCDSNTNGIIDGDDIPYDGVGVHITNLAGTWSGSDITSSDSQCLGYYNIRLLDIPEQYVSSLDLDTLPSDAAFVIPEQNEHFFETTDTVWHDNFSWLIDSAICRDTAVGCRVTGGGNDTSGIDMNGGWDGTVANGKNQNNNKGINRYTFGGQAGANTGSQPQPKGEWTHHQQRGPDGSFVFHAGTASAPEGTEIDVIICSDEGFCNPARKAPTKQIDFAGVGTFKNIKNPSDPLMNVIPGVTYHWFEVHIEDLGEPGSKITGKEKQSIFCPAGGSGTDAFADPPIFIGQANCGCADFYRIRIYEGVTPEIDSSTGEIASLNMTDVIYEVEGYIDGGNLQIHPPTGFDLK